MISAAALPANAISSDLIAQAASKAVENASLLSGQSHNVATKLDKWNLMKVRVGFDVTRKGERSLVIDGYKFTKSRDGMSDRVFWRCSRRECKATAVTVGGRVEHVRILHTHKPPTPGEFFSSPAAATTTTTTTEAISQLDDSGQSVPISRARRRSHQQHQQLTVKSFSETTEKNSANTRNIPAIISSAVERRHMDYKPSVEPRTTNNCKSALENNFQAAYHQQQSPMSLGHESSHKSLHFGELDSRGLSALADAAVHQSKRDSQNSTPDPPCEAPVASPSPSQSTSVASIFSPPMSSERGDVTAAAIAAATARQFVLLGQGHPSTPSLLVDSTSAIPFLPAPSYWSNYTRRFSVSEMPISAMNNLERSPIHVESPRANQTVLHTSLGRLIEAGGRGPLPTVLTPASAANGSGAGVLLHWKKEKMLESRAEEEEMRQHRRRRHFTGSFVADTGSLNGVSEDGPVIVDSTNATSPLKRKRCASACHPPLSYSLPIVPTVPNVRRMNDSATTVTTSPQSMPPEGGGGCADQEPVSGWCTNLHNDLLTQMFTTLQHLALRLSADSEADSVVANCRAIQACLDTISAIKRTLRDVQSVS